MRWPYMFRLAIDCSEMMTRGLPNSADHAVAAADASAGMCSHQSLELVCVLLCYCMSSLLLPCIAGHHVSRCACCRCTGTRPPHCEHCQYEPSCRAILARSPLPVSCKQCKIITAGWHSAMYVCLAGKQHYKRLCKATTQGALPV